MGSSCCKGDKGHEMRTKLAEETMDRHINRPKDYSESGNQKRWNSPKITQLAQAVNKLAVDIYLKIDASKPDQNIVFSPLAIALALALVETGMTGKHRSEFHKLIGPAKARKTECGKLYGALQEKILNIPVSDGELRLCNVLFRDHGTSVNESYQKKVKEWLKTEVIAAPFKKDAEKARQQVNRWIKDKTAGKIPGLLRESRPQRETALLLANAIYMRMDRQACNFGFWWTDAGTFHPFGHEEKQAVEIIRRHTRDELGFRFHQSFKVLEMPYTGGKMAMYIILPDLHDGIKEIEKQMSADWLINVFCNLRSKPEVNVSMPKFTMRRTISLLPIFGVGTMNGLGQMTGDSGASISEAVHEVDERQKPPDYKPIETIYIPPTPFTVDHPFLFFVVHKPTWTIVFMGKMNYVENEQ